MDKQLLGDRLLELRKDLIRRTGEKWPQKRVAAEANIKESMLERIEAGKGGIIEVYIALFNFYHNKGYNLNWIQIEDNSSYSKYRISENPASIEIERMLVKMEKLKAEITESVDTLVMDMLVNS